MPWGAVVGAAIGVAGNEYSSSKNRKAAEKAAELDPRMQDIIYGGGRRLRDGVEAKYEDVIIPGTPGSYSDNGDNGSVFTPGTSERTERRQINPESDFINDTGLLGQAKDQLNAPQSAGMKGFGEGMDKYLADYGTDSFVGAQRAAQGLMSDKIGAPTIGPMYATNQAYMGAAQASPMYAMEAAKIKAPGQNNIDLTGAYKDMVYGEAGNNPYLTGAIGKGINQSRNAFNDLQRDATQNFSENVLGNIRGGAIMNGQMGSSRQGIAEGIAGRGFAQSMGQAAERFGINNTDAAVAAQAGAYDQDRNRALSAMSGLGAQQYGVASQNAAMEQANNFKNYDGILQTNLTNAGMQQQANQFNGQMANANIDRNYNGAMATNQFNANAIMDTNRLNSANQLAGINASSGLLNGAYGFAGKQDAYGLDKLGSVSNIVNQYTGLGGAPIAPYTNTAGAAMAGATAGMGLMDAYRKQPTTQNSYNWSGMGGFGDSYGTSYGE